MKQFCLGVNEIFQKLHSAIQQSTIWIISWTRLNMLDSLAALVWSIACTGCEKLSFLPCGRACFKVSTGIRLLCSKRLPVAFSISTLDHRRAASMT
jgi:hypothetical protein